MSKSVVLSNVIGEIIRPKPKANKLLCKDHNNVCQLYCEMCQEVICLDCICSDTHMNHSKVKLEDSFYEQKKKAKVLHKTMDDKISELNNLKERIVKTNRITKKIVNEAKQQILDNLDNIVSEYLNINCDIVNGAVNAINNETSKIEQSIQDFHVTASSNDFNRHFELAELCENINREMIESDHLCDNLTGSIQSDTFYNENKNNSLKTSFIVIIREFARRNVILHQFKFSDIQFYLSAVQVSETQEKCKVYEIQLTSTNEDCIQLDIELSMINQNLYFGDFLSSKTLIEPQSGKANKLAVLNLHQRDYTYNFNKELQFILQISKYETSYKTMKSKLVKTFYSKLFENYRESE